MKAQGGRSLIREVVDSVSTNFIHVKQSLFCGVRLKLLLHVETNYNQCEVSCLDNVLILCSSLLSGSVLWCLISGLHLTPLSICMQILILLNFQTRQTDPYNWNKIKIQQKRSVLTFNVHHFVFQILLLVFWLYKTKVLTKLIIDIIFIQSYTNTNSLGTLNRLHDSWNKIMMFLSAIWVL